MRICEKEEEPIFLKGERRPDLEAHRARVVAEESLHDREQREVLAMRRKARDLRKSKGRRKKPTREGLIAQLAAGRRAAAERGAFVSGQVPYGYRRGEQTLEVVAEDAENVRLIFREYLRLRSIGAVMKLLLGRNMKTPRGGILSRAWLGHVLRNPHYVGRVRFGSVSAFTRFPAIVAPIVYNQVQLLLTENARRK